MTIELADVIAETENNGKPWPPRFEPALHQRWTEGLAAGDKVKTALTAKIQGLNPPTCSQGTAAMIACTSWGAWQILGETLYGGLWERSVFAFLTDPAAQRAAFEAFLAHHGVAFTLTDLVQDPAKRQRFIAAYNGPGDEDAYWAKMKRAVKSLGGPVILA